VIGALTTASTIRALAERHNVAYAPTTLDGWANDVTRLSGDEVTLDEIELLLLALLRAGHFDRPKALRLQAQHLREIHHG
jgi:hypothetical protein